MFSGVLHQLITQKENEIEKKGRTSHSTSGSQPATPPLSLFFFIFFYFFEMSIQEGR
jgi:hypothetical protein